jgi:thioredoxin-like negative regulator of GroEL
MKRILSLALIAVAAATLALAGDFPEGSPAFATDFKKVAQEAESSGKPVVLVFSATWCPPCQLMKKDVYPAAEVKALHDKFLWAYIDVDQNPKLAGTMGVRGIPDVRFLSSKGKELGSQVGMTSAADFAHTLEGMLKKAAQ